MALIVRTLPSSQVDEGVFVGTVTFDSEYPAGGEAFAAADLDWDEFHIVVLQGEGLNIAEFDYANEKIILNGGFGEYDDLSALAEDVVIRVLAYGLPSARA